MAPVPRAMPNPLAPTKAKAGKPADAKLQGPHRGDAAGSQLPKGNGAVRKRAGR